VKINFRLPWKLRLPYKVTRAITSRIYHAADYNMWRLRRSGFFPENNYREEIHATTDYICVWRKVPTGHLVLGVEQCKAFDTGIVCLKVVALGFAFEVQVEDWQEVGPNPFDNIGIYGSELTIHRIKNDFEGLMRKRIPTSA